MFCPKCSQQQHSDETRFCSRCGFQLGVVKAILASDEAQGATANAISHVSEYARRKRDKTLGALLMFVAALMVAAAGIDLPPSHSGRIIVLIMAWAALTLLINLVPLLRYFFGGSASSASIKTSASKFIPDFFKRTPASHNALPPTQSVPVTTVGARRLNTAEVIRPPSITEQTTNLLNNK
jgi:hypothetical protein